MECTFQVGDRVVCVDAYHTNNLRIAELEEGAIYTVAGVKAPTIPGNNHHRNTPALLHLVEKPTRIKDMSPWFAATRFRPVKPLSFWVVGQFEIPVV